MRGVSLLALGLGGLGLGLILVLWVPWSAGAGHPAVAPDAYFTSQQLARARDYSSFARVWSLVALGLSLAATGLVGFSAAGRRLVNRLPGPWWARAVLAVALIGFGARLLTLPISVTVWQRRVEEGLSTQSLGGLLRDVGLNELISVLVLSAVVLVVGGFARRWPVWWPALAGVALAAAVLVGSYAYPVVVEPLFNDFTSMPAGALRTDIMRLADTEGVHVDDVLVMDASSRTTSLNAYVSGFGDTRRVVLYDNLVTEPDDVVLTVVAHELAHASHDDVFWGSLMGAFAALGGCGALGLLVARRRTGVSVDLVPRFLAVVAVVMVLVAPAQNAISRAVETRADVVALAATGDPESFIDLQVRLAVRSLSDPATPNWFHGWWGSHPTAVQRIGLAT